MIENYFFEIPIYRTSEDAFFTELEDAQRKHLEKLFMRSGGVSREQAPGVYAYAEERFRSEYGGGAWRYNQIIGWLRLYFLGMQIRGELWFVPNKRISRKIKDKRFEFYGKAFEHDLHSEMSSAQIYQEICSELDRVCLDKPLKNRYLDTESFYSIGSHVNWRKLLGVTVSGDGS